MGAMFKDFSEEGGVAAIGTAVSKAVQLGTERGNPGGDGSVVEVTITDGGGTATIEAGMRYAQPILWSALPDSQGVSWTIEGDTLTLKTTVSYSGVVTMRTFS